MAILAGEPHRCRPGRGTICSVDGQGNGQPDFPSSPAFNRLLRWAAAVAMVACAVFLFAQQAAIRPVEARMAAVIVAFTQLAPARTLGTAILFPANGMYVGLNVTASCSIALLVSPFCLLAAGLVLSRRTSLQRGLVTLGVLALWLLVVNQARIVAIVVAVRLWGIDRGYDLSHVMFGTVVTTLGVLGGLFIFIHSLAGARRPVVAGG